MINLEPLDTTVVGSFPVLPFYPVEQDFPPYTRTVPDEEVFVEDPFLPAVFEALRLQHRAGIDYASYGQPQDMCSMFLGYLVNHGLEYIKGFQVVGDIDTPKTIPAIEYLQVALKYFSFKGVRMPLTGPFTLAAAVKVGDNPGIEYPEIIEKLAGFVSRIASYYNQGRASIICIDEPSLTYALYTGLEPDYIIEILTRVVAPITNAVPSVHVCGQLNPQITDILLALPVVILDHEFASIPANNTMYTREDLESHGKLVGFGCVETNVEPAQLIEIQKKGNWQKVIEPVPLVKKRITAAIDRWKRENIILDPDCGFGGMRVYIRENLTKEVAMNICYHKLLHMVEAKKEIV